MKNKMFKYFSDLNSFYNQHPSANLADEGYIVSSDSSEVIGTPGIPWESICFIESEKLIWTHGEFFGTSDNYVTQDDLDNASYAGYSYVYSAYSYLVNEIINNEYVVAMHLNSQNDRLVNLENAGYLTSFTETDPTVASYIKSIKQSDINNWNSYGVKSNWAETNSSSITYIDNKPDLSEFIDDVEYDKANKLINFKNNNSIVDTIDATDFIKDGMVDSVYLGKGKTTGKEGKDCMIITFNTDAGKEDIEIVLTDIFNPENYYDISDADDLFVTFTNLNQYAYVSKAELNVQSYVTNAFLSNQGYLTSTNAAQIYQTISYVSNAYTYLVTMLGNKIDSNDNLGLSEENFTTELKERLLGIAPRAEENIQSDWNENDSNSDAYIRNKPVIPSIAGLVSTTELSTLGYVTQDFLSSQSYAAWSYVYDSYAYVIEEINETKFIAANAVEEWDQKYDNSYAYFVDAIDISYTYFKEALNQTYSYIQDIDLIYGTSLSELNDKELNNQNRITALENLIDDIDALLNNIINAN